jgi:hypothetical protein
MEGHRRLPEAKVLPDQWSEKRRRGRQTHRGFEAQQSKTLADRSRTILHKPPKTIFPQVTSGPWLHIQEQKNGEEGEIRIALCAEDSHVIVVVLINAEVFMEPDSLLSHAVPAHGRI